MQEPVDSCQGRRARGARLRSRDSRGIFIALVAAAVLALPGCSASGGSRTASSSASNDPNPSVSDVTGSRSSLSPNPPTSTSPTDVAKSQVLAFVPTYYAALDQLSSSPTASLNGLDQYAVDADNTQEKTALAEYRANGWVSVGTTKLSAMKVTSVDLSPANSAQPVVMVTTCIDVSDVKEVDKAGNNVTVASRPDFFIEQLTVVNIKYPDASGWRVSDAPNKGASSCIGV